MSEAYINKWAGGVRVETLYDDTYNLLLPSNTRMAIMNTAVTLPTDADILVIRGTIKVSATGGTFQMFTDNASATNAFFEMNSSSLAEGIPFSRMWLGGKTGEYWVAPTQATSTATAFIPLRRGWPPQDVLVRASYNVNGARAEGRIQVLAVWFG